MAYRSTKTYGHDCGLSAVFRQHRADSHCRLLHGYALAFSFVFEATTLDARGWVIDFGGLGALKSQLKATFDHKLLIAGDDPQHQQLIDLDAAGIAAAVLFPNGVGCEAFARYGFYLARDIIQKLAGTRVRVVSCEVREHGANSAIYQGGAP